METDSAGASIFETFFTHWSRTVAGERFPEDEVELVSGAIGGLASQMLREDPVGWFERQPRRSAVVLAWRASLAELSRRMGPRGLKLDLGEGPSDPSQACALRPGRSGKPAGSGRSTGQGKRDHRV